MESTPRCPSPSLQWKCLPSCSQQEAYPWPSPLRCLWHNSSRACFHVSHDEDDKSIVAGERRLKNRLNYPLLWGCVSSRCVVFIAAMFTFISTCRKCVTISSAPRSHAPAAPDIRFRLWTANRCYRAQKMFCLPSISEKPRAWSRPYLSECTGGIVTSRGPSTGMCISLSFLKGSVHPNYKVTCALLNDRLRSVVSYLCRTQIQWRIMEFYLWFVKGR